MPLDREAVAPPSPEATDLQYKYLPPQAVKLVAPNEREFPVPIREVGWLRVVTIAYPPFITHRVGIVK